MDALALRDSIPAALGPIMADPEVVKVLHGADSDIKWLQRDFGIYVVSLFDTGQAARVLGYPSFGLAYLLKTFCGVDADKAYQVRTIPSPLASLLSLGPSALEPQVCPPCLADGAHFVLPTLESDSSGCAQMADWRCRPLTAEMLQYARDDTHYLLYIYDLLRKELSGATDVPEQLR